jgi:hypothetical protein
MKKNILLFAALFFSAFLFAQKVDLDRYRFDFSYRNLPQYPLVSTGVVTSYSVIPHTPRNTQAYFPDERFYEQISFKGVRPVNGGQSDVQVHLYVDELDIRDNEVKELFEEVKGTLNNDKKSYTFANPKKASTNARVVETKDKDNIVSVKKYYYYVGEIKYSFAEDMEIKNAKGDIISKKTYYRRSDRNAYETEPFAKKEDAYKYLLNNNDRLKEIITTNLIQEVNRQVSTFLNQSGYPPVVNLTDHLWILDNSSHPEYVEHQKAIRLVKGLMPTSTPNNSIETIKRELQPVLEYFESVKTKYKGTEKPDKKIRYASYYNKAVLYLYLDDPEAAIKEASGLITNGFDTGDGKDLMQKANDLLLLFQKNKTNTRHFGY